MRYIDESNSPMRAETQRLPVIWLCVACSNGMHHRPCCHQHQNTGYEPVAVAEKEDRLVALISNRPSAHARYNRVKCCALLSWYKHLPHHVFDVVVGSQDNLAIYGIEGLSIT